ncbi:MAG: four helix bundle protein [Calditrichaeota bacterium]|nr:four helix bundle protein [Calditrichota bacterium]
MTFKKLEDIDVWKRGCRLAVSIYKITVKSPFDKDWGLRDQIRRSSVSIPSNIAEGYERNSPAEFRRFLLIAKGSCGELRTQLYILKALDLLESTEIESLINECIELSSMIQSLVNYLQKSKQ